MYEKPTLIIPACNEGLNGNLARTLSSLPKDIPPPIVAVNGSEDTTAEVAESFGARIVKEEIPGKDRVMRRVLSLLTPEELSCIITTDADVRPANSKLWLDSMEREVWAARMLTEASVAICGLIAFAEPGHRYPLSMSTAVRSVRRIQHAASAKRNGGTYPGGANQAFSLTNDTVAEIIDNPELYWPGEDAYYVHTAARNGIAVQSLDPRTLVFASSRYHIPLLYRALHGPKAAYDKYHNQYVKRGQPGTIPYVSIPHATAMTDNTYLEEAEAA